MKTALINAALEPTALLFACAAAGTVVISLPSNHTILLMFCALMFLAVYGVMILILMKKNGKKYGNFYFQVLHKRQMAQLEAQLSKLEQTPLVQQSEKLLGMYWNLRLSGDLSDSRKDTLADATERYFSIMTSSLNALSRISKTSPEGLQEIKKLTALSSAYHSALTSECIAQTSAGNKEGFDQLLQELNAITFANEQVRS